MDAAFHAKWRERESIGPAARALLREILARCVAEAFRLGAAIFGERLPRLIS